MSVETDVSQILRQWEEENQGVNYDPIPILTRLAQIIEGETENYLKMDPDPFDDRHPSRTDPDCALGHILKVLFKKDSFMNKLVNDYLRENYYGRNGTGDNRSLNVAACRLMLDIMPGLETSAVFQQETESLILRLFSWAERGQEPLQSYATGILAAAMEVQDIAANFREHNARLVPLMLQRLHALQKQTIEEKRNTIEILSTRPFAGVGKKEHCNGHVMSPLAMHGNTKEQPITVDLEKDHTEVHIFPRASQGRKRQLSLDDDDEDACSPRKITCNSNAASPRHATDCSNSSWAEMESYMIGSMQIYPPNLATQQMMILRYLTPMGEYQELLSHVFEHSALELILGYINLREMRDSRLAFEALKYLAALLCHKKFSIEFINAHGLQKLLDIPRPSIAATGVSMCLYYLAYCEDAMERVCLLPRHVLTQLVQYALWLLECSHESGRCHATMFFGLSFQFRVILELFDHQDGLRKLYNVVSTLPILSLEEDRVLNEDEQFSARQTVRHVCVALKRYFEAHLAIKVEQLRRTHFRDQGGSPQPPPMLPYKAGKWSAEQVQEQIELVLELMPFRSGWTPIDELVNLGGITLLLQIIAFTYEWNYSGRAETVRSALDVLAVCSVLPSVQLLFCEKVDLPDETLTLGMNIILGAVEGEIVADPDVQRSALHVIINCVCGPIYRVGGSVGRYTLNGPNRKKAGLRSSEELITRMWDSVRSNNGIMVLLQLMMVKTPITDADSLRALACRALAGLARSETVRQIVSKLPLFTNGQMQLLTRDPILQDKRQEHVKFQKYALELLERVSGKTKPTVNEFDASLANIHRANAVAQTRIHYNECQLLHLVHRHLTCKGLTESAAVLQREAGLPGFPLRQGTGSNFPLLYHRANVTPIANNRPRLGSTVSFPAAPPPSARLATPVTNVPSASNATPLRQIAASSSTTPSPQVNGAVAPMTPIRMSLSGNRRSDKSDRLAPSGRSLQKPISHDGLGGGTVLQSPSIKGTTMDRPTEPHITLDSIVTEYLMNQHALCKNPVVTCPQFNLFEPHKCPDPKSKSCAPTNVAVRLTRRPSYPPWGGPEGIKLDRRFVHSRFRPAKTFRMSEDDGFFTCCAYSPCDQMLMIGTYRGEVKLFNLNTGQEEATYQCHESYMYSLQPSSNGSLLLTSSTWRRPVSALWSTTGFFEMKLALEEEEYVEFSKLVEDRMIGTKGEVASIYDIATGKRMLQLTPRISNQYTKNRATFSPSDELVLSDGVLWDVNSGKEIHKFDKLNQSLSGIFHPNGLEVISNTEVWDLRTFHLLRTVPALDQCSILIPKTGKVMYCVSLEQETEEDTAFESSFKTIDPTDYTGIATIDVKKNIYDLNCNRFDTQIAVVENQGMFDSVQESTVRLYDVGRCRDDEDEAEEEEDEDDMDGSDEASEASATENEDEDPAEENAAEEEGDAGNDEDEENASTESEAASTENDSEPEEEEEEDEDDEDEDDEDEVVFEVPD